MGENRLLGLERDRALGDGIKEIGVQAHVNVAVLVHDGLFGGIVFLVVPGADGRDHRRAAVTLGGIVRSHTGDDLLVQEGQLANHLEIGHQGNSLFGRDVGRKHVAGSAGQGVASRIPCRERDQGKILHREAFVGGGLIHAVIRGKVHGSLPGTEQGVGAGPVRGRGIHVQDVIFPLQIAHEFHGGDALGGGEVAYPASILILIFQGALSHAAKVPRDIGKEPAAVGFAGWENQTCLAGLFPDDLAVFRHFLEGLGIDGQTFFIHQACLAEELDVDVHAQHVAVPG